MGYSTYIAEMSNVIVNRGPYMNLLKISIDLMLRVTRLGEKPPLNQIHPEINTFLITNSTDAYTKLFKTALFIATAEESFTKFPLLIDLQKKNGIKILEREDSIVCTTACGGRGVCSRGADYIHIYIF